MNAHGKIILIGEHSVVYGKNAIAIPLLDLKVSCQIKKSDSQSFFESDYYTGFLENVKKEPFYHTIQLVNSLLNKHDQLVFKITSMLPHQRGMGSSAAVSIAIIRAMFEYYQVPLDDETLFSLSFESEKIAHTNPSGLDSLICAGSDAYFFSKSQKQKFNFNLNAYLLICDSGIIGKTKTAIQIVMENYNQDIIDQLGLLANEMKDAIISHNLNQIGHIMQQAHHYLASLKISTPQIDAWVDYANQHALGAKLSGGGLGGCFIVLCETIEQANLLSTQLKAKGVPQIWTQKI